MALCRGGREKNLMTNPMNSRREELRKILPKKKPQTNDSWRWGNYKRLQGYNRAIDDCLSAFEDKVILRNELLSMKEIEEIIRSFKNDMIDHSRYSITDLDTLKLAQQIHNRQEKK